MRTLSSEDAAALLHLNVKRVQSLARDGKLPAVRVGRRWLFDQDQLETLLGGQVPHPGRGALDISARNRLRGTITRLRVDGLMAEVVLRIGEQELVSVITRASAERMRLQAGDEVFALVKSTEVMIGREAAGDPA
jgi:molybdate transport system regulatory protein